jgi:hypothetical protein
MLRRGFAARAWSSSALSQGTSTEWSEMSLLLLSSSHPGGSTRTRRLLSHPSDSAGCVLDKRMPPRLEASVQPFRRHAARVAWSGWSWSDSSHAHRPVAVLGSVPFGHESSYEAILADAGTIGSAPVVLTGSVVGWGERGGSEYSQQVVVASGELAGARRGPRSRTVPLSADRSAPTHGNRSQAPTNQSHPPGV